MRQPTPTLTNRWILDEDAIAEQNCCTRCSTPQSLCKEQCVIWANCSNIIWCMWQCDKESSKRLSVSLMFERNTFLSSSQLNSKTPVRITVSFFKTSCQNYENEFITVKYYSRKWKTWPQHRRRVGLTDLSSNSNKFLQNVYVQSYSHNFCSCRSMIWGRFGCSDRTEFSLKKERSVFKSLCSKVRTYCRL